MWKIDSDGDAYNADSNEIVTVTPSFTVTHWRITKEFDGRPKLAIHTIETFDSEDKAREFLRIFVNVHKAEAHHAD